MHDTKTSTLATLLIIRKPVADMAITKKPLRVGHAPPRISRCFDEGCAVSVEETASAHRLRPSPFDGAPITAAVLLRRFLTLQRCRVLPMLPRGVT